MTTSTVLSRGQQLYEQWASAGGSLTDFFPWDRLSDEDHRRWQFIAKGGLVGVPDFPLPADVTRYGDDRDAHPQWWQNRQDDRGSASVTLWDFLSPPEEEYLSWVATKTTKARHHWWQFWRPPMAQIDTSEQAYWESFLQNPPSVTRLGEPVGTVKSKDNDPTQ